MRIRNKIRGRKRKPPRITPVWSRKAGPLRIPSKRTRRQNAMQRELSTHSKRSRSSNLPSPSTITSNHYENITDASSNDSSYLTNSTAPDLHEQSMTSPLPILSRRSKHRLCDEDGILLSSTQKRSVHFSNLPNKSTSPLSPVTTSSPETYETSKRMRKYRESPQHSNKVQGTSASTVKRRSSSSYSREASSDANTPTSVSPRRLRLRQPRVFLDNSFMSMDSFLDETYSHPRQRSVYCPKRTRSDRVTVVTRRQSRTVSTRSKGRMTPKETVESIDTNPDNASESISHPELSGRPIHSRAEEIRDADEEASDDEDEENKQPDGRRYPVRNRRNTAVYQVETNTQSPHGPHRDWLAGTGFEGDRRRTRHRSDRHIQHCGSSTPTSSSSNSDSEASTHRRPRWSRFSLHPPPSGKPTGDAATPLDVDVDEMRFARRFTKSIINARSELLPINMSRTDAKVKSTLSNRLLSGTSLADIEPMSIDDSVGFEQVGGHDRHIESLKECILLPLMYPEVFSQFNIDPPRGVLFSGPPGTGKTLLARALANECGRLANDTAATPAHQSIAFFMRKGADCMSKWVGESERQLRLLFDQAYRMRPSIIFFDEIDGLAPVRSSRQDQIHSSIVSTLLSLMDGLDHRAEVVVIGATNRPDAIDPALRRPGRFDREFVFHLPTEPVRLRILQVQTAKWQPKLELEQLQELAYATNNFSGADLKALVTEACLCCLRRRYPQVYSSQVRLTLDPKYLVVTRSDWLQALRIVRPSNDRSDVDCTVGSLSPSACALASTRRSPLQSLACKILLTEPVDRLVNLLAASLYPTRQYSMQSANNNASPSRVCAIGKRALLLHGDLPSNLMTAVWHRLESVQVFTLDSTNLVAFPTSVGVCPEAAIAQIISAVRRSMTSATPQMLNATTSRDSCSPLALNSLSGVILHLPCIDILLNRMPRQTSVYLIDRLTSLLHDCHSSHDVPDPCQSAAILSDRQHSGHQQQPLLLVATLHRQMVDKRQLGDASSSAVGGALTTLTNQRLPATTGIFNGNRNPPTGRLFNGLSSHTASRISPSSLPSNAVSHAITVGSLVPLPQSTAQTQTQQIVNGEVPASHCPPASPTTSFDSMWSTGDSEANQDNIADSPSVSPFKPEHSHSNHRLVRNLISRLFQPTKSSNLCINTPSSTTRRALFTSLLNLVYQNVNQEQLEPSSGKRIRTGIRKSLDHEGRAPSPPPAIETSSGTVAAISTLSIPRQPLYSPSELLALEREEAQLFRRHRQVLRRVVAHLARHRRFAVFTRPVQIDDAPDYYEVIKQPMDLGSIRDKIDAHYYTNVIDFMQDIELIYRNALEYNPANVPRSREIRSRASEFWDEACLQLEEELHPADLDEQCRSAFAAQKSRQSSFSNIARGSDNLTSVDCDQSSVKPPLPMPLGGRYSRRLHGEAPALATTDVRLLQMASSERALRRHSQSMSTVDTDQQETVEAEQQQPQMELDEGQDDSSLLFTEKDTSFAPADDNIVATFGNSPSLSETVDEYVLGEDSILQVSEAGRQSPSDLAVNTNWSPSVVIQTSPFYTPAVTASKVSADGQEYTNDQPVVTGTATEKDTVNYDKLLSFCHRLTKETQGWLSDQLLCLYDQLALLCQHHRLQQIAAVSGKPFDLLTELDRLFVKHCTQEISEHIV